MSGRTRNNYSCPTYGAATCTTDPVRYSCATLRIRGFRARTNGHWVSGHFLLLQSLTAEAMTNVTQPDPPTPLSLTAEPTATADTPERRRRNLTGGDLVIASSCTPPGVPQANAAHTQEGAVCCQ